MEICQISDLSGLSGAGISSTKIFLLALIIVIIPVVTTMIKAVVDGRRARSMASQYGNMLSKLDMLIALLYEKSANNVTIESARDIIDAQYSKSMYELLSEIMVVFHSNNIKDAARQAIIRDKLVSKCRISHNRDIMVLNKIKCFDIPLSSWMIVSSDPDKISKEVYEQIVSGAKLSDVMDNIYDIYTRIITAAQSHISALAGKHN